MKIHNPFRTAFVATLGVGAGIAILMAVQNLGLVLLYVGTALFLSLGIDPVVSFLERRGLARWLAVTITVVLILGIFGGLVSIILSVVVPQITQLVQQITRLISAQNLMDDVATWLHDVFPNLDVDLVLESAQKWLLGSWTDVGGQLINATLLFAQGLMGAFIVLILTIYLTASTPSLKSAVYQLVPASKRGRFVDIAEQITDSVGFYVMGQVSLGAINGVLSFFYLSIINAPFPAVLAVVAFCGSLIPLVGTITGSTFIVLACLLPEVGSPGAAIAAGVYYLIYMQIEAYVISPRIMGRAVAVPGAVVVIAALAGGALGGLLGALVAIPIAASLLIVYRQVVIPQMNER
ncbi:AI-2E family transporter [Microbacterium gorillae]|uniref:AI-2E family transporter n=1 Tax=Microbacterium gorillae TaxID=1231063 RepID=UPI0005901238|nr:AI-2E family transporter [Microbacterium gorillae]